MLKKVLIFIMFFFALSIKESNAKPSSIMIDARSGNVIYEQNADELRYPASLTKLMTLYITFNALEHKHITLDEELKVSRTAAGRSPSKLGVKAGETISVKDAIMAVIVKSANDCATVLAERFSKTEADFAVLMTKTAKKLGMNDTTFKNASGLPNSKQKTTARDMAILSMAVYRHFPQYYKWFSAQNFMYKGKKIYGHNNLLKTFSGADGMKTGYTAAAGYNIVTSASRNNNRVIAVTMGHRFLNERDKKAAKMMDKGLQYLQNNFPIDIASLAKEIDGPNKKTTKYASARKRNTSVKKQRISENIKANSKNYAIQIGSFSDYQRARNFAISIKNKLAKLYSVYDIKIEKVKANSGIVYRSKVVGLDKKNARQICQNMKRNKQSCLVVAENNTIKLAQK